jgi:dTDP-4-amino-4,6-dideoxygalactose transaminase
MAQGVHKITEDFEKSLCDYTGAPYAIALDNMSNALFLSLYYEKNIKKSVTTDIVTIPTRTYPSVPCEIIHTGLKVEFSENYDNLNSEKGTIKGSYNLHPTNVWDSALSFTANMYKPGTHMCVSFTGPYKTLKLSKGGAILTDDYQAMLWFKRARFSGRRECSYHDDNFDMLGWNFYMMPELAARGLLMMSQFYNLDGSKKQMDDLELPYPDLSKYEIYIK